MAQEAPDDIRIAVPRMPEADALLPYLRHIDEARYYSNFGPLVREFEARMAAELGVAPAMVATVSSGTQALILGLRAACVAPGTLCMMPAWTFSGRAHAAREAGLIPYFVDVSPESWALSPEISGAALREAPEPVGAVMPVAPFGAPIDYAAWDAFADETGIAIAIDAAAAFDAWPFVRAGYVRLGQAYAASLSAIGGVSVMAGFGGDWAGT
ncbi:MAG: hypothetical protein CMM31_05565, partial [Rhodospirillaceae bacterium]|nr:hypothetical protein [Rhodospirillaceae bacterium]